MTLQTLRFDGAAQGDLASAFSFSRNVATVDGTGVPVGANSPRYDRESVTLDHVADSGEIVRASASANLNFFAGVDTDGKTPLGVMLEGATQTLYVFRGSDAWDAPVTTKVLTTNGYDLMEGADAGYRYQPVHGVVCHGLITVVCTRRNLTSSEIESIAIGYSTDLGATWEILEDTSGNKTFPTVNSGQARGTNFSLHNWWPEVDGQADPLAVWFATADYQINPGASGGQTGLFRATRASINDPWVVDTARLILQEDGFGGTHFHSAYPLLFLDEGKIGVVTARGDTIGANAMILSFMSVASATDYKTAAITDNTLWHGGKSTEIAAGAGLSGLQFCSAAPGPIRNSALVGADFNAEVVALVLPPDPSEDWSTARARIERVYGHNTGSENYCVICRDPARRRHYISGHMSSKDENYLLYSEDGYHWSEVYYRKNGTPAPQPHFYGDQIIDVSEGVGLRALPIPKATRRRPLLVGPGTKNQIGAWSQWTAPEAGCTLTKLTPNAQGKYVFPAGHSRAGEVLPEQPQSLTEVWHLVCDGVNDSWGYRYLSAVAQDDRYGDHSIVWGVLALTDGAEHQHSFNASQTGTGKALATEQWEYFRWLGSNDGNARPNSRPLSWSDTSQKKPSDFLLTFVSHHTGQARTVGYPVAPDTDSSAIHELAAVSVSGLGSAWSVRMVGGLPLLGDADVPAYLLTIWEDISNYVEVYRSANEEVTLAVTVGGTTTTATVAVPYFQRSMPDHAFRLLVSRLADGTTELLFAVSGSTLQTALVAAAVSGAAVELRLCSNADQTDVCPFRVFDVAVETDALNASNRALLLSTADLESIGEFMPSASEIAAEVIAGLTAAEIEARLPVTSSGTINTLTRGDDYLAAHGRQLSWSVTLPAVDTTGATCHFGASSGANKWLIDGAVSRVGDVVTMSFDLPSAATINLDVGMYSWTVELRSSTGKRMTQIRGTVTLEESQTIPSA